MPATSNLALHPSVLGGIWASKAPFLIHFSKVIFFILFKFHQIPPVMLIMEPQTYCSPNQYPHKVKLKVWQQKRLEILSCLRVIGIKEIIVIWVSDPDERILAPAGVQENGKAEMMHSHNLKNNFNSKPVEILLMRSRPVFIISAVLLFKAISIPVYGLNRIDI